MASPQPALTGADSIRALKDDDAIFKAFDGYPWTKDKMFMSGLYAILGEPGNQNPSASLVDMAIHARVFYYAQRIGVNIDFSRYKAWLARHPDKSPPQVLPDEYLARDQDQASAPALDWQKAAPKTELFIDRKAAAHSNPGDQPSYPMGFAEMLQLLQEGKPVPGIRQIPNTVVRNPSVKPVGSRTVPRKPWEKAASADIPPATLPQSLDTEFPPINDDQAMS